MEFYLHDTLVPQGGKGVCLLHMMVDMVVGPCLHVEDLGGAPPPCHCSGGCGGYTGSADLEPAGKVK